MTLKFIRKNKCIKKTKTDLLKNNGKKRQTSPGIRKLTHLL